MEPVKLSQRVRLVNVRERTMATLIVLALPEPGKRCHVTTQGSTVMGRDPTCDLVLDNRSISRLHAHIIAQRGRFYLEDNNSTNGT